MGFDTQYLTFEDLIKLINQSDSIEAFAEENLLLLKSQDDLHILNYSEKILDTPRNWISHYCRGLVIGGTPHNYKYVAKGFNRFYNQGEDQEYLQDYDKIDYSKPFLLMKKYDGSLFLQFRHNGKEYINTRGSFGNQGMTDVVTKTWRELFKEATVVNDNELSGFPFGLDEFRVNQLLDDGCTFIWEVCSLYNQVVEVYPKPIKTLLGIIDPYGFELTFYDKPYFIGKTYEAKNFDDIQNLLSTLKPTEEGFVVAQIKRNKENIEEIIRKKIKTQTWKELSATKSKITLSGLVESVCSKDLPKIIELFPHLLEFVEKIKTVKVKMEKEVEETYSKYKDIQDQKEFANKVKKLPYASIYFILRKNQDITEQFKKLLKQEVKKLQ